MWTRLANKLTTNENYRSLIRTKRNSADQIQDSLCKESGWSNTTNILQLKPVAVWLKKHEVNSKK
jgi:hypothetical protein